MLNPIQVGQFKRDVRLCKKRDKDMSKLRDLMLLLIEEKPLPSEYKDHPLKGNWRHHRDSHMEPDWLLIYKIRIKSRKYTKANPINRIGLLLPKERNIHHGLAVTINITVPIYLQ